MNDAENPTITPPSLSIEAKTDLVRYALTWQEEAPHRSVTIYQGDIVDPAFRIWVYDYSLAAGARVTTEKDMDNLDLKATKAAGLRAELARLEAA